MDIKVRSWIATIYFVSHTGLGSLNQVFDRSRKKNLRHRSGASVALIFSTTVLIGRITGNINGLIHLLC